MVLVYLMGVADILAAFMLLTGFRSDILVIFVAAILLIKGIPSFMRFNLILYLFGSIDLLTVLILSQGTLLISLAVTVGILILLKGVISFWQIDLFKDTVVGITHSVYRILKRMKKYFR